MTQVIIVSSHFSRATNIFRARPNDREPGNAFPDIREPTSIPTGRPKPTQGCSAEEEEEEPLLHISLSHRFTADLRIP
jgi:hypothetical protein